ncbi:hypothetical protein SAMN06265348_10638 [Pedobacter westerhofensis]|uniref:Uncharacterized protein n=1 Tax=Pedobacter westerhofensis TaxID=425512 RepID=A0A521DNE0_9SPHI|nr:hypothetical protein SAMN06265348_10638 [Pedobacter westerhofensis]
MCYDDITSRKSFKIIESAPARRCQRLVYIFRREMDAVISNLKSVTNNFAQFEYLDPALIGTKASIALLLGLISPTSYPAYIVWVWAQPQWKMAAV